MGHEPANPDAPRLRWVCEQDLEEFSTLGQVEEHLLTNTTHAVVQKWAGAGWPA